MINTGHLHNTQMIMLCGIASWIIYLRLVKRRKLWLFFVNFKKHIHVRHLKELKKIYSHLGKWLCVCVCVCVCFDKVSAVYFTAFFRYLFPCIGNMKTNFLNLFQQCLYLTAILEPQFNSIPLASLDSYIFCNVFISPISLAQAYYGTRLIFQQSIAGLSSEFSFSYTSCQG